MTAPLVLPPSVPDGERGSMPSLVPLGLKWAVLELKAVTRSKDAMGFLIAFPLILLVMFAAILVHQFDNTGISAGQYYTPVIIASSVIAVGVMNLAVGMAIERTDGTTRRLALTPLPVAAYLIGKLLMTLALTTLMTTVLLAWGVAFYHVHLPTDPSRWFTFAWVFLLGVAASTLIGIFLSTLPSDGRAAPAVLNPPFIVLQFISGVYIPFAQIPPWLRTVASVFPMRWLASGMRSVFLPGSYERVVEPGGSYDLKTGAVVLAGWALLGSILAVKTFRWERVRK
jgi:ABC-2 type transport system permease protein